MSDKWVDTSVEVICLHCKHREIRYVNYETAYLEDWKCNNCQNTGHLILTGSHKIDDIQIKLQAEENKNKNE